MLATKRLAGVTPEVNLMEPITHTLPPSANKAATVALKPRGDITKTGVSVALQKGLMSSKNKK